MKIAIESNDGVTLNSPFTRTKGYLVCEINEAGVMASEFRKKSSKVKLQSLNDCRTIISRGMDRDRFMQLKNRGLDVFITFKSSVNDAIHTFMKESILEKGSIQ